MEDRLRYVSGGEGGGNGSEVECLNQDRGFAGSNLTGITVLFP